MYIPILSTVVRVLSALKALNDSQPPKLALSVSESLPIADRSRTASLPPTSPASPNACIIHHLPGHDADPVRRTQSAQERPLLHRTSHAHLRNERHQEVHASEAKSRHLCLCPLVTKGMAGGVAASHETEQAPDAPWGWRTRRRESQRRSHELCRKSRCCPPSPCEVGGLCAGAYKKDVTSPVGTSACGVRVCVRVRARAFAESWSECAHGTMVTHRERPRCCPAPRPCPLAFAT